MLFRSRRLSQQNASRRANAAHYSRQLADVPGVELPFEAEYASHVYHLYVVRVEKNRAELMRHLNAKGVGCLIHYPTPIHLQPAYEFLKLGEGSFPCAETSANEILSLPMFPGLSENEIVRVAEEIKAFSGVRRAAS